MEQYRIDTNKGIEFGLYSNGEHLIDPMTGKRIPALIEASQLADEAGLDVFAVGESHQTDDADHTWRTCDKLQTFRRCLT